MKGIKNYLINEEDCKDKNELLSKLLEKYNVTILKDYGLYKDVSLDGFNNIYLEKIKGVIVFPNIEDLQLFDKTEYRIKKITIQAFSNENIKSRFLPLKHLEEIDFMAFSDCHLTGDFKNFPKLRIIDNLAFSCNSFNGVFTNLKNLESIGEFAFEYCKLTGDFKDFPKLKYINNYAFIYNSFNGVFKNLPSLISIGCESFLNSCFYDICFNDTILNENILYSSLFLNNKDIKDYNKIYKILKKYSIKVKSNNILKLNNNYCYLQ